MIIVCDFDGTLTPDELPKFEILEKSGMESGVSNPKFFEQVKELVAQEKINFYEAFIKVILRTVSNAGFELTDENIGLGAKDRIYNPGIMEFLQALKDAGVRVYILSSGAKAYLEQTKIAPFLTEIFASTLTYDKNGKVDGIGTVMMPEQKSNVLRKLARELNDNEEDCRGIIYFGDGPTDIDAMKYIKEHNGMTVLVYNKQPSKEAVEMASQGLADLFTMADYSKGGEIYNYIFEN